MTSTFEPMTGTGYRRDIQGLRAVAVLLVIADHAGAGWLSGGFVGVDVFFVISGYLITRLLVREDAVWSAIFAANVHFARLGTDYFAQGREPSPFQHRDRLDEELSKHHNHDRHDRAGHGSGNSRNGARSKTVPTLALPQEANEESRNRR